MRFLEKLGICLCGIACSILLIGGAVISMFVKELTQWRDQPPLWCWQLIFTIFIIGILGFFMALIFRD